MYGLTQADLIELKTEATNERLRLTDNPVGYVKVPAEVLLELINNYRKKEETL